MGSNPTTLTSSYGFHLLLNNWQHEDAHEKHKAKAIEQTAVIDARWHIDWQIEIVTYIKLHDSSVWLKTRGNLQYMAQELKIGVGCFNKYRGLVELVDTSDLSSDAVRRKASSALSPTKG